MKRRMNMKKSTRTLAAILMSAALTASACALTAMPVFAESYTITIQKQEGSNDKATHTYEAYQVFKGKLNGTGADAVLSDIDWGSGVNGAALLTALQETTKFGDPSPFASCTTAAAVAKVIDAWENDTANVQILADIINANLSSPTIAGTAGNTTLTASAPGYYFIKDKDKTLDGAENGAYTDFILKVVDSVTITPKEDVPTITKKILENSALKEANTASVGDTVNFQLDSTVPDMSAYNKYYYVINDIMCGGLTFDSSTVKVYIDNMETPITSGNYEVQTGADAKVGETQYSFQIVMKNFKGNYGDKTGRPIKVTYSAKLNKDADRTDAGNPNTVNLTYSNNPNHEYKGENEPSGTPEDGDVTGKTPDSTTKTYTTSLMLKKIDGDKKTALENAKFRLTGSGVNEVIITKVSDFVADANGTYYMLKDETFTLTAPTDETQDKYASTTVKYKLNTSTTTHSGTGAESYVEGITDKKGILTFAGLGAGTYTLSETEAPNGYNKLANDIEIEITANPTLQGPNWEVKKDNVLLTQPNGIYEFTVENNMGATLPSTGGIGTTIFYVVGGSLIAGAVVLFITKKRMGASDDK